MIAIGGFKQIVIEQGGVWAVCHTIHDTEYAFSVTPEEAFDILDWHQGNRTIQDALGYLDHDYRELLLTGITPGDWIDFLSPSDPEDDIDPHQFEMSF